MTTTDRWKYLVIRMKGNWLGQVPEEELQSELNVQGALGWEFVQLSPHPSRAGVMLIFKRPA